MKTLQTVKTLNRTASSLVMSSLTLLRDDGKLAAELVAAAQDLLLDDPQTAFDHLEQLRELLAAMVTEAKRTHYIESRRGGKALNEFLAGLHQPSKAA